MHAQGLQQSFCVCLLPATYTCVERSMSLSFSRHLQGADFIKNALLKSSGDIILLITVRFLTSSRWTAMASFHEHQWIDLVTGPDSSLYMYIVKCQLAWWLCVHCLTWHTCDLLQLRSVYYAITTFLCYRICSIRCHSRLVSALELKLYLQMCWMK